MLPILVVPKARNLLKVLQHEEIFPGNTRASFPACGSPVLSEALPVTQHGRRGRNCTLSCSEHCPSEWAAPTKQSFLEEAGLLPFRRPPFIYLDVYRNFSMTSKKKLNRMPTKIMIKKDK
ncbi:hypothetical protein H5410_055716 [Solanum commersonii]|uniref:Uncharacterized protein n=1 Tax=Solanum commersonii TaxID=4109 RepID=A0A9J5WL17_SOLCO|nr:hypothetical protein H5410_055716 [Solanum commersonii]